MNSIYLRMEKILFSFVVRVMCSPKRFVLWSLFHTLFPKPTLTLCAICCESQHHRITHVGRELVRSLLQPPAHSRLALRTDQAAQGFIQLRLENLLGWSVVSCPKTFVTSTYGRDKEAEKEPSHRRGQDHTEGWWQNQGQRPDLWHSS